MQRFSELAEALRVAAEVQPRVIVEIGCMDGGTLYAWRQICDRVYGITLPVPPRSWGSDHGAIVLRGDSHDPASKAWLEEQLDGPVDVLHIDGDHTYDGVRADFEMYEPLVRRGGLVLIHDVANKDFEVSRFWQELNHGYVIAQPRNPVGFGVWTKEET